LHCKNICDSTNKYSYWKSKKDYYQKRCIALSRLEYNIEYQYHPNNKSLSDNKSVKEKLSEEQGFATWCPPDFCDWKLLSQNKQSIAIVNTYEELLNFLGEINNEYEAYLLLLASQFGDSNGRPYENAKISYRYFDESFYFSLELQLSDCPIERYKCLIKVSTLGKVELIDKKLKYKSNDCI